ncbi:Agenet domain containing protein [Trema orientale]|uniref:Agenet domain containing protein n=1 Tax=Trema orientale TaxID=63057 RepID=A0A2P5F5R4_TREOI|nr:Agenet domain containing protein [Trema orientale]
MSRPYFIKKGDQVEVTKPGHGSTGPYFPATVLRSPAKTKFNNALVFVEYRTLKAPSVNGTDGYQRLKEVVNLVNVRPAPPPMPGPQLFFKVGDDVDVFLWNGWSRGVVMEILEDSRYLVLYLDTAQEIVCPQHNLRLHMEWDDGSWVPPLLDQRKSPTAEMERNMKLKIIFGKKPLELKFGRGAIVEVSSDEEGYKDSWYIAKIVGSIGSDKFLVEYQDLLTDDGAQLLREEADARHIRPEPPLLPAVCHFKMLQKVDAWYNDGWWEGVISELLTGSQYVVYFRSTNEELIFKHSNLRPHLDWINGKWSIASKEHPNKWVINSQMQNSKLNFCKRMKIEVRSDEEGYTGSWYEAKVVRSLGNDKFLVEYQTLKTDDGLELHKEEADALNIRPCPPEIQHVYPYALHENVDAWYNDGWWVGRISKVLVNTKYMVYFWTTNEELEFEHCNLRPHQEWADGFWVDFSRSV